MVEAGGVPLFRGPCMYVGAKVPWVVYRVRTLFPAMSNQYLVNVLVNVDLDVVRTLFNLQTIGRGHEVCFNLDLHFRQEERAQLSDDRFDFSSKQHVIHLMAGIDLMVVELSDIQSRFMPGFLKTRGLQNRDNQLSQK
jgi:hypothetical protein